MPTYEYRCDACGHAFEVFQSMAEAPKKKCPACSARRLQRVIGAGAGIIFKGTGFYQTDYRSDSYKKGAEAETKATQPKSDAPKESGRGRAAPEKKAADGG